MDGFACIMGARLSRWLGPLPPMTPACTVRGGVSGVDKHAIENGPDRWRLQTGRTSLGV
jgi:hypothetical protein